MWLLFPVQNTMLVSVCHHASRHTSAHLWARVSELTGGIRLVAIWSPFTLLSPYYTLIWAIYRPTSCGIEHGRICLVPSRDTAVWNHPIKIDAYFVAKKSAINTVNDVKHLIQYKRTMKSNHRFDALNVTSKLWHTDSHQSLWNTVSITRVKGWLCSKQTRGLTKLGWKGISVCYQFQKANYG